jgi:release factor glutamine methyltransferase
MNHYIRNNRVADIRQYLKTELIPMYGVREANQISKMLFEHFLGWNATQLLLKTDSGLSESEILLLHKALKKLKTGQPVQYVLGAAHFLDMTLAVNPSVLIPRPETEELVRLIAEQNSLVSPRILDVGTGSGCIAIGLKNLIPQAKVAMMDLSVDALLLASRNAAGQGLDIEAIDADIFHYRSAPQAWDIIVSNPPYIPISEKQEMHARVVQHEPHMALFVPDQNPLLFYERILQISKLALAPHGKLYFEIHERMADSLRKLAISYGLPPAVIHKDMQGKERMMVVKAAAN